MLVIFLVILICILHDLGLFESSSPRLIAFAVGIIVLQVLSYFAGRRNGKINAHDEAILAARKHLEEEEKRITEESAKLEKAKAQIELDKIGTNAQIDARIASVDKRVEIIKKGIYQLRDETLQSYPWLAKLYSDYAAIYDGKLESQLRHKSHPALKAADSVAAIAREKRELQQTAKMLEYQLHYYETVFPWLEEFKEIDPKSAYALVTSTNEYSAEEPAMYHHLLSPTEYAELSTTEKYQLALDRYVSRKKTNWQVGIEYERYIGYIFETQGYKVKYQGAITGLSDLGRDLIATKDGLTSVIQCKRWARNKTIHEKHIFQLFGSKISWEIENSGKQAKGILYSTTSVSDVAKRYADYLGIDIIIEDMRDYPLIKCNVGNNGEKIYHLPFDQQYDRLYITPSRGDLYVATVSEAEALGFRRAYRWQSAGE